MYKEINGESYELWIGSSDKSVITQEKKRIKDIFPGKQSKVRQITISHAMRFGTGVYKDYELLVDTKTYNNLIRMNIFPQ